MGKESITNVEIDRMDMLRSEYINLIKKAHDGDDISDEFDKFVDSITDEEFDILDSEHDAICEQMFGKEKTSGLPKTLASILPIVSAPSPKYVSNIVRKDVPHEQ